MTAHTHDNPDRLTVACPACCERVVEDQDRAAHVEEVDS